MLRVVQWATGKAGSGALEAMIDHPELEVVGVRVFSDEKAGRDAGELVGRAPIGVKATKNTDDILALDADCVVYMPLGEWAEIHPMEALDEICTLLSSGKNVVSTAVTMLIQPASLGPEAVERLEKACAEGNVSFHATGIEPGWCQSLPLVMSGLLRRTDSILYQELLNYASWDNAEMLFDNMGFGQDPDVETLWSKPEVMGAFFHAPLMLLADGLSATIDRFDYHREVWLADEDFDIASGHIEKGTVAAMRFGATAVVNGRPALTGEHVTRLRDDDAPEWPKGRGWRVTIEGNPSMVLESRIAVHGEDENEQACTATGVQAVHAVIPVCAAQPGIRTYLDLPMITGRYALGTP
jgi:hypothetical protein